MHTFSGLLPCLLFYMLSLVYGQDFELTILHTNDVHAKFEQINKYGGPCSKNCYGGVARRKTVIQEIRQTHKNVLLLDAGDQFQGTLWFTYYRGNATKYFMELLGYDLMTFGNHEFDEGVEGLVNFLDGFDIPVVSANVNSDGAPDLKGLYTASHVFQLEGRKVAVLGYVTPDTAKIVLQDGIKGLVFESIVDSVEKEIKKLKSQGINIIIALGHAGFAVDVDVAKKVKDLDLIIGGHTNTFLYTGKAPSNDIPVGDYPYMVKRDDGSTIPVVQAFGGGKYLGYLNLTFDGKGNLKQAAGNPILIEDSVKKDPEMQRYVEEWKEPLDKIRNKLIGRTFVFMDGQRLSCRVEECNMGNMAADALVRFCLARLNTPPADWAVAPIGMQNAGGIRNSFEKGNLTQNDVIDTFPFRNSVEVVKVKGSTIWKMMENSVHDHNETVPHGRFLQISGMRVVINRKKPKFQRVVSIDVRCSRCEIPKYSPIDRDESYMVATNNFLVQGGDGYTMIREEMEEHYPLGNLLSDVLSEHVTAFSPLMYGIEGRIIFNDNPNQRKVPVNINCVKPPNNDNEGNKDNNGNNGNTLISNSLVIYIAIASFLSQLFF